MKGLSVFSMTNDIRYQSLAELDPEVADAISGELSRQRNTLEMIASENFVPRAVLQAQGSVFTNKYAEGYQVAATTVGTNTQMWLKI